MPKSSQSKQVLHFIKLHRGHLENLTWLGLPGLIKSYHFSILQFISRGMN